MCSIETSQEIIVKFNTKGETFPVMNGTYLMKSRYKIPALGVSPFFSIKILMLMSFSDQNKKANQNVFNVEIENWKI